MSEHVITIDGQFCGIIDNSLLNMLSSSERTLKRINKVIESREYNATLNAEYWQKRRERVEKDIEQLQSLMRIFKGAESVTVTHNVKEKNYGN